MSRSLDLEAFCSIHQPVRDVLHQFRKTRNNVLKASWNISPMAPLQELSVLFNYTCSHPRVMKSKDLIQVMKSKEPWPGFCTLTTLHATKQLKFSLSKDRLITQTGFQMLISTEQLDTASFIWFFSFLFMYALNKSAKLFSWQLYS